MEEIFFSLNKGGCPSGSVCCGEAEYLLEYCENVGGQWSYGGGACECAEGFTESEVIDAVIPGLNSPVPIRLLRCFIRDCGAVGEDCCGVDALGDCSEQWPGGRFSAIPFFFQHVNIGCFGG